ncbi:hypothetical protein [Streptomyces purpurogeneiscleroticus]|uniref:hypothetical protein n=1 Tax=Streptomyces purpurogeneiscleroticus TaxID=68259 RepID=UPI001CBCD60B|nr:hypothetical protein [Streptomyces purpurogeneiscleroticus]MBZ4014185.1 hypothetical protein [Streptomyces purpurogeneiscleroticus]
MTHGDWTWDYNPSKNHVAGGLPLGATAEVERLATELAALGRDAVKVGRPVDREGGLREFDILGGRGFISFLAVPRHECIYICNITWYG